MKTLTTLQLLLLDARIILTAKAQLIGEQPTQENVFFLTYLNYMLVTPSKLSKLT